MKRLVALGIGLALAGCHSIVTCDAALVVAIKLAVRDAQTGASVVAQSTVIATLRNTKPDTLLMPAIPVDPDTVNVGTHAGTYDLVVKRAGYADWKQTVVVVADGCEPSTTRVTATLERAP